MEAKAILKRIGGVWVIEVEAEDWVFLDMQADCESQKNITIRVADVPGNYRSAYPSPNRLVGVVHLEYKNLKEEKEEQYPSAYSTPLR